MYGHQIGGCVPFYIDWGYCDHPSATIPEVGALKTIIVRAPSGHKVHSLLESVSGITVEEGDPMLEFSFGSPEGTITFSADNPNGVKFPGFEEGETGSGGAEEPGDSAKFPGMPDLLPTSAAGGGAADDGDDDVDVSDVDSDSDSDSD